MSETRTTLYGAPSWDARMALLGTAGVADADVAHIDRLATAKGVDPVKVLATCVHLGLSLLTDQTDAWLVVAGSTNTNPPE